MGLARAFAAAGGTPRTLIFVTFAGEEMGLLGSAHYVRHPALPLDRTVLMVNLDMVGRLRDDRLFVGGADSAKELRQVVDDAARGLGLTLQLRGDPFSPSDHTSFYTAGRPVLFLFTGAHGDYHRPTDTWEKINAPGLATVATLGVRPGSPADKAGVRAGDVIVRFAGVDVKTLEDLTFALRGHRAGDRVDVVVERDGKEHQVSAVLENRR